jgi:hypothetical protein
MLGFALLVASSNVTAYLLCRTAPRYGQNRILTGQAFGRAVRVLYMRFFAADEAQVSEEKKKAQWASCTMYSSR